MGGKRVTIEEVEERIKKVHGDTVVIVKESFIGTGYKATFIDKEYGSWEATVSNVLAGTGNRIRNPTVIKINFEEIEKRLFASHGETVTLIRETYSEMNKKATFIDKDFGEWTTKARSVIGGTRHPSRYSKSVTLPIEEIKVRIRAIYGNDLLIVESSYKNTRKKAKFIDCKYGEFEVIVNHILQQRTRHPQRVIDENLNNFGNINPLLGKKVRIKGMKTAGTHYQKTHWKTGEFLDCQASYEPKVVDYLNTNKIDFLWQPQTFVMPNGVTYRPDLFLVDTQTWVEIKGWMRPDAQEKWDWFKTIHPTAELWNQTKLKEMGIL
jgi:hypothetical protein